MKKVRFVVIGMLVFGLNSGFAQGALQSDEFNQKHGYLCYDKKFSEVLRSDDLAALKIFLDKRGAAFINRPLRYKGRSGETFTTPLHAVIREGNIHALQELLRRKADPNKADCWGRKPLYRVVEKFNECHYEKIEECGNFFCTLVSHGADPLEKDTYGDTLLHQLAAVTSHFFPYRSTIDRKADRKERLIFFDNVLAITEYYRSTCKGTGSKSKLCMHRDSQALGRLLQRIDQEQEEDIEGEWIGYELIEQ